MPVHTQAVYSRTKSVKSKKEEIQEKEWHGRTAIHSNRTCRKMNFNSRMLFSKSSKALLFCSFQIIRIKHYHHNINDSNIQKLRHWCPKIPSRWIKHIFHKSQNQQHPHPQRYKFYSSIKYKYPRVSFYDVSWLPITPKSIKGETCTTFKKED